MNYLEELVSEWYEFNGYFVRRNVRVGRRSKGGYEGELDVVAFHPETRHLVHIEPSMDADSWANREERFRRKFAAGRKHIPALFAGLNVPHDIEQIAVLEFASKQRRSMLGGAKLVLVSDLLVEILSSLRARRVASNAVPEDKPILRTLQFVAEHKDVAFRALNTGSEKAQRVPKNRH
jgi:hypothetical protein